jgi:peptide/nickel transport system substrate-binding protein
MIRTPFLVGLLFSIAVVSGGESPVPKVGGRLTYGSLRAITTTNPFRNTVSIDYTVRSLMFEGLTGTDAEGNIVPCLTKSWEASKDGLTYTFSLRSGVRFHNGKTLTSEDVRWSIDHVRDPKNRAYYLDQVSEVKSIDATDPLTVVFTLKKPFSPFPTMVGNTRVPILPAGSQLPADSYPPGTGPFRFAEWQPGQHLTLKAFKQYWTPGVPYLEEIVFKPITEDNVRVTALRTRAVDIADEIPYPVVAEARKGRADFNIATHEAGVRARIVFNTRIPPFNDVRLRQAIAYAVDKNEVAMGATWGFAKPTNQRYPSSSKWFIDLKDREQNLQKARALMAEAGYRDGLRVKTPVHGSPGKEVTTILKDQLKKIGIELELDVMDFASHTKVRTSHEFTLYAAGMGARIDPDQIYYVDLHSKSKQNGSGYSNPEVDQMLERTRGVHDVKERKRLFTEVLKLMQGDVPEIYLYIGPNFSGVAPHVKAYVPGFLEDRVSYIGGGLPYTWIE